MAETIQFGPERRKTGQTARYGYGSSQVAGAIGEARKLGRKAMSPEQAAAWKLYQSLEKFPNFTKEARQELQNEFTDLPNLKSMNMKALAATLSFLQAVKTPTVNLFRDEIVLPHIEKVLPLKQLSVDEKQRLILRYKAQILMYVRAIQRYRKLRS